MREAKSMYFGGEIIAAEECDYQTSRDLGLVCPFCSSAVFIRSESVRQIRGKLKLVQPYFAHYPSGTPDNWDCEKRSRTKQGRERIEQIKIQARNQRLKLYNAHLWEMIAGDRNISHHMLNKARSLFGERWCEHQSILVRREWALDLTSVYAFIDDAILSIQDQENLMRSRPAYVSEEDYREELEKQARYFLECDRRLNRAICCEVADFLATNTSRFVFLKIFKACLWMLNAYGSASEIKKIDPRSHLLTISGFLAGTHWIDAINRHLQPEANARKS